MADNTRLGGHAGWSTTFYFVVHILRFVGEYIEDQVRNYLNRFRQGNTLLTAAIEESPDPRRYDLC